MPSAVDDLSRSIGALQSITERLAEANTAIRADVHELVHNMMKLVSIETELREYRKTMHDRLNRIHEIIDDFENQMAEVPHKVERVQKDIDKLNTTLKVSASIGVGIASVLGWATGLLPELIKHL